VLGGLGSVAGGGDFANGALTAAFGYLFNQCGGDIARCFGARSSDPADIQAEAWQRWIRDFRVGVTVYLGWGIESTLGAGIGGGTGVASTGFLINFGSTAVPDVEYGWFGSTSETIGYNPIGKGFFAGFNWGTVPDFQAASVANASTQWIGGSANFHPELGFSGMAVNQPGLPGLSYGPTTTCVYTNLRKSC
jgi:hypothetical protein